MSDKLITHDEFKKLKYKGKPGEKRFRVGDIVVLSESYGRSLRDKFRGEIVGYSKGPGDINGNPCVRVKRLDLASGSIQVWGQGWLEREAEG